MIPNNRRIASIPKGPIYQAKGWAQSRLKRLVSWLCDKTGLGRGKRPERGDRHHRRQGHNTGPVAPVSRLDLDPDGPVPGLAGPGFEIVDGVTVLARYARPELGPSNYADPKAHAPGPNIAAAIGQAIPGNGPKPLTDTDPNPP